MKTFFRITFMIFVSVLLFTACNKDEIKSCKADIICYTQAPDSLWVKLDLDNKNYNGPIRVKLYVGNMDDGKLYDDFTTTNKEEYYLVPVDQRYTGTAQYLLENNDTLIVIDSDKLDRSYCKDGEASCYDWDHEISLNLKVK